MIVGCLQKKTPNITLIDEHMNDGLDTGEGNNSISECLKVITDELLGLKGCGQSDLDDIYDRIVQRFKGKDIGATYKCDKSSRKGDKRTIEFEERVRLFEMDSCKLVDRTIECRFGGHFDDQTPVGIEILIELSCMESYGRSG